MRPNRPPKADYEIDATGMYVMPGFVDLHVHAGGAPKNADAEYAYKLWLAHGVTTVRGVPLTENALSVKEKERSAKNEIVAPRIFNYQRPGAGWGKGTPQTPEQAREWVNGRRPTASTASSSAPSGRADGDSVTKRRSWAWARRRTWRRPASCR